MKIIKKHKLLITTLSFFMLTSSNVFAANDPVGQIVSTYGQVYVLAAGGNRWNRVGKGQYLFPGNTVKTEQYSGASLRMEDESLMRLSQNTEFEIEAVRITSFWRKASALVNKLNRGVTSTYRLLTGKLWGRNNNRDVNAKVVTSTATIGIRGTEYVVEAEQNSSSVSLQEGSVFAENEFGTVTIASGEQVIIQAGSAPIKSLLVQTGESVQWTILVPELINITSLLEKTLLESTDRERVINAYQENNYEDALQILKNSGGNEDVNKHLVSNWILIKAGESFQVYQQLSNLYAQNKGNNSVIEMLAFSAFLINKIDQAKTLISDNKNSGQLSDMGWIIDGYINQSEYQLEAAEHSYLQAIDQNPKNIQAKLLLSRIYFGSEQTEKANLYLKQVIQNNPQHQLARTLYGFILLSSNQTSEAASIWQTLIEEGNSDADTYFGLSLANMRMGRVDQAMQNIATAVLLNPQRSMYLSYWGKMLHQIGRYDKALTVLDSAIRLDNNDPTPKLYKAIILRDLNRPGEAIKLIQSAKSQNNNRGVYRSRSLLDKDLAVQNVDISRIYNQLGLSHWAHKQAIASIKKDFTNASAHVLNAGAFADQPNRAYALGSEALLARLLQPANQNAFNTFNGYTSLFEAPETEYNVILGAGNHNQLEGWLIANGAKPENQFAWSMAAFHESSDGWRDINGDETNNLSIITKWQPDAVNNYLLTLSVTDTEQLDFLNNAYDIDVSTNDYSEYDQLTSNLELGLTHQINNSHLLMSYLSIADFDSTKNDRIDRFAVIPGALFAEGNIPVDIERPYYLFQLQGLKRLDAHEIKYGLLYYDGESNSLQQPNLNFFDASNVPQPSSNVNTEFDLDIKSVTLYLNDSWTLSDSVLFDLGIYLEDMDNANGANGGEWNQKESTARFGVSWSVNENHTLRLAAFEYLLPFLSNRLDPTDVAGIPIFKNTNEGSLVTEYDIMWDFEWGGGLLTVNVFKLEESFLSSTLAGSNQVESVTNGEKEGAIIDVDLLAGLQTGVHFNVSHFDVSDESNTAANRQENNASLKVSHITPGGFSISLEHIKRDINFNNATTDENISVTNFFAAYEFADKTQIIEFEVINLSDEEFNWVTDKFDTTGIAPERMAKITWQANF